jgi:hypothetical protein
MKILTSLTLAMTLLMVMTLLSVSASATDEDLIVNRDFEANDDPSFPDVLTDDWDSYRPPALGGWVVANTFPDSANFPPALEIWDTLRGYSAASGTQNIELDGNDPTTISQTPATAEGYCYELSYAWSPRPGWDDNQMKVYVDDVEVAYHSASGAGNSTTQWTWETLFFQATNSSTTIALAEVGSIDQRGMLLDAISLKECPLIAVGIDINPGGGPNGINLKSNGKVPVAILTTDDFNAYDVDPVSCEFAGAYPVRWNMKDVDNDGVQDILLHFMTQELELTKESIEATLEGETYDGIQIIGTDSVSIAAKNEAYSKKIKKHEKKEKKEKISK